MTRWIFALAFIVCHPIMLAAVTGGADLFAWRQSVSPLDVLDAAGYYIFHIIAPIGMIPDVVRVEPDFLYIVLALGFSGGAVVTKIHALRLAVAVVFCIALIAEIQNGLAIFAVVPAAIYAASTAGKNWLKAIYAAAILMTTLMAAPHYRNAVTRAEYSLRHVSCDERIRLEDCRLVRPLPRSLAVMAAHYAATGNENAAKRFIDMAARFKETRY